ncbi:protein PTHB1-like isoform X1 [Patiria miniata]|uniref:Protein PTHB1 n=1 Tax=Patiria miniata TaxID=46514 RepID=A0A914APH9_PATMI|nr:protein PTHB1-like isoform X1 [Patiria miniata]XP_038065525.1 protein PTHB1-like isoform X1 [Patiria miniata]XP_038065526.1 protein PTHB1-like isoform X1 [Patiria miniata]
MSLFKARDWWSHTIGSDDGFDQGSLCVANIDNNSNHHDKVIVGGFNGVLRIYQPRGSQGEANKAEAVLLEMQLPQPILQAEAGRFVSVSEKLHLAVLHPRKLTVYSVSGTAGAVEHGSQYQMKMVYEHNLQRTAFNLVVGPFGSVKGKDFLCVQSMDGTVSFFEQESFSFSRFLPGFLLPGPLRYIPRTDSFVTVSSSWQVESYKYQVLAVATDVKTKEESQKITSGKRITMDWSYSLGEAALDIVVTVSAQGATSIVILGERSIVCLKDTGALKFMKKLEYNPSCFFPHGTSSESSITYMVATHTRQLMIYQDTTLKWAAKLEYVPVSIRVGQFQDLKGVITSIDDQGHLVCSYLGTDPSLFVTPSTDSREINYEEQDLEMKKLQRAIKESASKQDFAPKKTVDEDFQIEVTVPPNLDSTSVYKYFTEGARSATETEVEDDDPIPSITVKLVLKTSVSLPNVRLLIHCPYPISVNQSTFTFPFIGDSSAPTSVLVSFFLRGNSLPASLTASAMATYTTSKGAPRVVRSKIELPLKLVVKPCPPVKTATYKITIDSNKNAANLNDVFPDLLGPSAGGPGQALGFQIIGGPKVTILASKSSQRYRLQSDVFESMWLVIRSFLDRIQSFQRRGGAKDFQLSYGGIVPLTEYFELIDTHLELRINAERYKELLDQRARQFRAIQRRLLTRFKDKTPSPLANLDTLLDGTYRQILKLADGVEENHKALVRCSLGLSCATHMIVTIIKLANNMTDKESEILHSSLMPHVPCDGEQGWEEAVDASISNLLRTCLAKKALDQAVNPTPLIMPSDSTRLKKHISQLCERLSKGARLYMDGQAPAEKRSGKSEGVVRPSSSTSRDFSVESTTPDKSKRLDFRKSSQLSGLGDAEPNPSPAPLSNSQPPVSFPPGIEDLPSPGAETNGTLSKEEVPSSPAGGTMLGDLPSLGGPGVRGTSLPPLGAPGKLCFKFVTITYMK